MNFMVSRDLGLRRGDFRSADTRDNERMDSISFG